MNIFGGSARPKIIRGFGLRNNNFIFGRQSSNWCIAEIDLILLQSWSLLLRGRALSLGILKILISKLVDVTLVVHGQIFVELAEALRSSQSSGLCLISFSVFDLINSFWSAQDIVQILSVT